MELEQRWFILSKFYFGASFDFFSRIPFLFHFFFIRLRDRLISINFVFLDRDCEVVILFLVKEFVWAELY
jgi:hypothetical protein